MSEQPNQYTPAETSTMAVISLIAGIAGWSFVPLFGSIVAVITGYMARKEIRESDGVKTGDGMATIGLVLGYASIGAAVLGICAVVAMLAFGMGLPFCLVPFANQFQLILPALGF